MVDILAGLAAAGVGVVLTIHQPRPDVFRLMHRVLLLSGRGQVRQPVTTPLQGPKMTYPFNPGPLWTEAAAHRRMLWAVTLWSV